jgi:hypothetical protein
MEELTLSNIIDLLLNMAERGARTDELIAVIEYSKILIDEDMLRRKKVLHFVQNDILEISKKYGGVNNETGENR